MANNLLSNFAKFSKSLSSYALKYLINVQNTAYSIVDMELTEILLLVIFISLLLIHFYNLEVFRVFNHYRRKNSHKNMLTTEKFANHMETQVLNLILSDFCNNLFSRITRQTLYKLETRLFSSFLCLQFLWLLSCLN